LTGEKKLNGAVLIRPLPIAGSIKESLELLPHEKAGKKTNIKRENTWLATNKKKKVKERDGQKVNLYHWLGDKVWTGDFNQAARSWGGGTRKVARTTAFTKAASAQKPYFTLRNHLLGTENDSGKEVGANCKRDILYACAKKCPDKYDQEARGDCFHLKEKKKYEGG